MKLGNESLDQVVDHMVDAVDRAEAIDEPFSHLYMTGVFPEPIYMRFRDFFPADGVYKDLKHKDALRADGSSTRKVFPFGESRLEQLPPESRRFWTLIRDALSHPRLQQALFRSLGTDLRIRVSAEDTAGIAAYPKSGLFRDLSGYRISPHLDVHSKLVTTQFYLPLDNSQQDFGTSLYTRDWIGRINRELKKLGLSSLREFTHVKTFPYAPNSGYAFVVGKKSWHGRSEVPEGKGDRYSLMNIYYRTPDVPFYD
jgi:hypothetical protein